MCTRIQVCHLVLVISTVAGNGYISESEKTDFQRTSHLDQLSLSVQQSVAARNKQDHRPRWLRPPPPGRFRDMSYLGYHRLEHALPPTPLPAVSRNPVVPTLPPVSEASLQSNRTKGKIGIVTDNISDNSGGGAPVDVKESVIHTKESDKDNIGKLGPHSRWTAGKDVNRSGIAGKKEHQEVMEKGTGEPEKYSLKGGTGNHSRKNGTSGKDGNGNSSPTNKDHLEVSESVHEPSYAAHNTGYPGRGGGMSSGRVRWDVKESVIHTKESDKDNIGKLGPHSRWTAGKDVNRSGIAGKKEHQEVMEKGTGEPEKYSLKGGTGNHSRKNGTSGKDGNGNSSPTNKDHLEVSESVHEPSYAAHNTGYPGRGGGMSSGRVRIQVYRGPTKKVGYKYFAPWGYYVSQPSDNSKSSSYGYH